METVISVLLGVWISLAGVFCLILYKKDFKEEIDKESEGQQEMKNE